MSQTDWSNFGSSGADYVGQPSQDYTSVTLYVSEKLENGPIIAELRDLGYSVQVFAHGQQDWLQGKTLGIYVIHEDLLIQELLGFLDMIFMGPVESPVVVIGDQMGQDYLSGMFKNRPFFYLPPQVEAGRLGETMRLAADAVLKVKKVRAVEQELDRAEKEIEELNEIGMALSSEKDPDRLLQMILSKCREIAHADAGSLYLVEGGTNLRFKLSQNVSLNWQVSEDILLPINDRSIVGAAALSGKPITLLDAYVIPTSATFSFNRSFDQNTGYRSKSIVAVPMKNHAGEVLGVVQLINRRRDFEQLTPGEKLLEEHIEPFTRKDLNLISSLASQATIALENSRLVQDIQRLFEGFVHASIVAIESRDPTTCGHSERVAALTVHFAETIDAIGSGPFAGIHFDKPRLTEIRYASLLHDFGKVGVREEVLVKAKKLFPWESENLRKRFALIRKSMEADFYHRSLDLVLERGVDHYRALQVALEANYRMQLQEMDDALAFLLQSNEPTVLEEGNFNRLLEIAKRRYVDLAGQTTEYLNEREMHVLSIRKGSLSEEERIEIESHVTHTFNFLSKIPWTKSLKRVPEIAYAHHEKLNGRGYPNHLEIGAIPFESQLMTICDIYDALTARDRPYKRALPREKALDIMFNEVKQGLIARDLLEVFVQREVFKVIEGRSFRPQI
ncbi:MAG TPA: GAF domain-containing protein [Candidatus Ozemobacteraceae bacterium]|nr:GAF domain-containing protein [Candidatus Ozemobacteraceae bacterium]